MNNRPVSPKNSDAKIALIAWLEKNDQETLNSIKLTADIFGPIDGWSYLNRDAGQQADLLKFMKNYIGRLK